MNDISAGTPKSVRILRPFRVGDIPRMAELFKNTVRTVNSADYSAEQTAAWTADVDLTQWSARYAASFTVVCEADGALLGFGNLTPDGTIDMLYVNADFIRCGIGSEILAALTEHAHRCGLSALQTFASLTAKPFFDAQGWHIVRRNAVTKHGVVLENFLMRREL